MLPARTYGTTSRDDHQDSRSSTHLRINFTSTGNANPNGVCSQVAYNGQYNNSHQGLPGQVKLSNLLNPPEPLSRPLPTTVCATVNGTVSTVTAPQLTPHYIDENHRYSAGGADGVPIKYQKSCNYCRHRKIKCVVLPGESSCNHCRQCKIECIFSRKLPSKGRILKSARISAQVYAQNRVQIAKKLKVFNVGSLDSLATAAATTADSLSPSAVKVSDTFSRTPSSSSQDYSLGRRLKQPLQQPNSSPSEHSTTFLLSGTPQSSSRETDARQLLDPEPFSHIFFDPDSGVSVDSLATLTSVPYDLYFNYIFPYTPFASLYSFESKTNPDDIFSILLNIACSSSPGNIAPSPNVLLNLAEIRLANLLSQGYIADEATLGLLSSIMVHCKVNANFEDALWRKYQSFPESQKTPELSVGVASVAAWYSLLHGTTENSLLLKIPLSTCESLSLDEELFSYHFVELSLLLYKFQVLLASNAQDFCSPEESASLAALSPSSSVSVSSDMSSLKYQLLRLESALLLWPVKLPKELTVVKDDLLATSGAVILHILHNTVTLAFYFRAIKDKSFGRYLSIYAVPGLLQFLCGMATSSLKVGPSITTKWPIVRHYIHLTAQYVLSLYEETEFEHCKVSLAYYEDRELDPVLYNKIRQVLGTYNWKAKDFDGAIIYWVFRDARSMSLDAILKQNA